MFTFLRAHEDNQVVVEVTGSRKLENGLVIPGTFKAVTRSRRLGAKVYEELNKVKQLLYVLTWIFLSRKREENPCDFERTLLFILFNNVTFH